MQEKDFLVSTIDLGVGKEFLKVFLYGMQPFEEVKRRNRKAKNGGNKSF